jgi:hypothetical protein
MEKNKKKFKILLGPETNLNKKCVAYPQEDFLFTILHGNS